MSWYYADNGRQAGPVDDASLDDLISRGAVRPDTLIWREGMANWQPLSTVRPQAPPPPVVPPAPVYTPPPPASQPGFDQPAFQQPSFQQQPSYQQPQPSFQPQPQPGGQGVTCANCGQHFSPNDVVFIGSSYVCAACKPVFLQRMREGSAAGAVGVRRYAGFWIRFAAWIIDAIIVGVASNVVFLPIRLALMQASDDPFANLGLQSLVGLLQIGVGAAYFGYFLSTRAASPGKLLLGLKVIRPDGSMISFARGASRYLAQIVSGIILFIGYIIAGFDAEKRALHDHLCDTRVVYK
jgi:uncharacterized RDD family membrane protein YckC